MDKLLNKIIAGDCIEILGKAEEQFADLIFADPPFNIGYKYDKYQDRHKKEHYINWTREWMTACCNVLKPTGSFYIAIGDDYAAQVKIIAEDMLGLFCRNWIIWHYTFGQHTKNKFARSHTHILYFVKDKNDFTFNDYAIRTPSDRQLIYNDKRANSVGKNPDDVWDCFSRVCGTFKERQGWHPCQMPELLLGRIIAASSNKGDCVLDPFIGSGTTAVVAAKYGRNYCGIDISESYVKKTIERIGQAEKRAKAGKNLYFNPMEIDEIKRLFIESGIDKIKLLANSKILKIFTKQFALRMNPAPSKYSKKNEKRRCGMNNDKKYDAGQVMSVIKDFADCEKRKQN
ncbi:MAG: site-specific DNA-methyltransferase [Planctomycetes bacterium HGW-Planctomycetes-1]|nr:MAG: site-specific DNA-methyltransferase [Planctomycetes bacterium HGW-Planctomycetes-1]